MHTPNEMYITSVHRSSAHTPFYSAHRFPFPDPARSAAMAEVLAGFLTSAVVNIAKDKLASAIAEQANLLWNFGDDLENMNSVLESISAALQDAERRSVKEKSVQLWLKRLKNAAFDISDLLDDYQDTSDRLTAAKVSSCTSASAFISYRGELTEN